jgi:hypothetical protein
MIRQLSIIAGAAFVLGLACTAGAVALVRSDLAANDWTWTVVDDEDDFHITKGSKLPPEEIVNRSLTLDAKEQLRIDMPQDVIYKQGPVASVIVEGPKSLVDRVRLENGLLYMTPGTTISRKNVIRFKFNGHGMEAHGDLDQFKVTITSPSIKSFEVIGSGDLEIKQYNQPTLDLAILGSGDARASGIAKSVKLSVMGSGTADLESVVNDAADVSLKGSGNVTIAPLVEARVDLQGSGDVDIRSNPKTFSSNVTGSGSIAREGHEAEEG